MLDCIERSIETKGYPPTFREVGSETGITSTNGVADHVKALDRKGYLVWNRKIARGLVPVRPEDLST